MARRSASGVNVSEKIREFRKSNRKAKPKAISEALAAEGIKVSAAYVSSILSMDKKKKKKGKKAAAGEEVATTRRGRPSATTKFEEFLSELQAVKQLVNKMGSIEKAQAALAALAKLQ